MHTTKNILSILVHALSERILYTCTYVCVCQSTNDALNVKTINFNSIFGFATRHQSLAGTNFTIFICIINKGRNV